MPNYLTVYPIPVAQFTAVPQTVSVLTPEVVFVNSSLGASTAQWNFGDSITSNVYDPTHEYADPGIYMVHLTVTSVYGCQDTISHPVEILTEFLLFVPNTFTPDGDGKNDFFVPILEGYEPDSYEWFIFNRWGDLIYQSNYANIPWDGNHNGVKAKEDVYIWKIKVKDKVSHEKKEFFGHVNLLR
jgi:gliding motility-associated-like protein